MLIGKVFAWLYVCSLVYVFVLLILNAKRDKLFNLPGLYVYTCTAYVRGVEKVLNLVQCLIQDGATKEFALTCLRKVVKSEHIALLKWVESKYDCDRSSNVREALFVLISEVY